MVLIFFFIQNKFSIFFWRKKGFRKDVQNIINRVISKFRFLCQSNEENNYDDT